MFKDVVDKNKTAIPSFTRTEVCNEFDENAIKVSIKIKNQESVFTYFHKPFILDKECETRSEFNIFPMVINYDGSPWALANLYSLDQLEKGALAATVESIAEDIGAFNAWLNLGDDPDAMLTSFPNIQLTRVTYRYHAHLKNEVYSGHLNPTSAQKRMSSVLGFYEWMISKNFFVPENPICESKDLYISFASNKGFRVQVSTTSNDLKIKVPESIDPYDGTIVDGGKLRPLSLKEQKWVFDTLRHLGNTEVYLIFLFMVMTGARIQTACTLRLKHFQNPNPPVSKFIAGGYDIVKLKAGPTTGIDTKFNKSGLLMLPKELYDLLHTYSKSNRAKRRYSSTNLDLKPNQYIFLTKQGAPYFEAKEFTTVFDPQFNRRHYKKGGTIRQFLKDTLIPEIRNRYDRNFSFRVHDLRATYGMNTESVLIEMVHAKVITMDKARQILCALMWHKSAKTTDHYLNYRALANAASIAVDDYGLQVQEWISDAKKGFCNELSSIY